MTDDEPTTMHGVVEAILEDRLWPHGVPRPVAATPHTARVVLDVQGVTRYAAATDYDRALCREVLAANQVKRGRIHQREPAMVDAVALRELGGLAATVTLAGIDRVAP